MMQTGTHVTEGDLVAPLIKVLKDFGGRAPKHHVDKELFRRFRDIFSQPYYQECVAGDIPRWRHFIAWAKEIAKHEGLVKRPTASGRGYWELTEKGSK